MANKAWKKLEQSDGFRKIKLKLKQLIGKEPKLTKDINLATEKNTNWVVLPEIIHKNDIVYSIGVCDDISFELNLIQQKNVEIFAFDPTPYSVKWISQQTLPSRFHFHPWAVSGKDGQYFFYPRISKSGKVSDSMYTFHKQEEKRNDGIKVDAFTIETMMKKLGHKNIDLLKMDIEGEEYEVLKTMLSSSLRPKQILVEFHHRFKGIGKSKTENIVNSLHQEGYLIADISVNGREVTFIRENVLN